MISSSSVKLGAFAAVMALTAQQVAADCVPYTSNLTTTDYPDSWTVAPGSKADDEGFLAAYNAVDWTSAPDISPKNWTDGVADLSTYDTASDPDCWWSSTLCTTPKVEGLAADIVTCPEANTWGLTFDDGPNCTDSSFYDFLEDNNQLASLFYIGSNVLDWPNEARNGYAKGHHIAVHTWSHRPMTSLNSTSVFAELYYTRKVIKEAVGVTPLYWRPPQGDLDDRVRWIAAQLNLTAIMWNHDTDDWDVQPLGDTPVATIDANYEGIVELGKNGSTSTDGVIVLTHEVNGYTMDLMEQWYPNITAAYKHVVPVATCRNITKPYAEDIVYPDFATYIGALSSNTNVSTTANNANGDSAASSHSGAAATAGSMALAAGAALAAGSALLL